MKWVFVVAGAAMVIIGGIGKYVDMTKFKEPIISNNSPYYTIFMTGVITVILGLSFDWIMSLDDEDEEADEDSAEGDDEGEQTAEAEGEQEEPDDEAGEDETPEPEASDEADASEQAADEAETEAPSSDSAEAEQDESGE